MSTENTTPPAPAIPANRLGTSALLGSFAFHVSVLEAQGVPPSLAGHIVGMVERLEREHARLREALTAARELLGEAARDEINVADELEKWDRAFESLLPNAQDQTRRADT